MEKSMCSQSDHMPKLASQASELQMDPNTPDPPHPQINECTLFESLSDRINLLL